MKWITNEKIYLIHLTIYLLFLKFIIFTCNRSCALPTPIPHMHIYIITITHYHPPLSHPSRTMHTHIITNYDLTPASSITRAWNR